MPAAHTNFFFAFSLASTIGDEHSHKKRRRDKDLSHCLALSPDSVVDTMEGKEGKNMWLENCVITILYISLGKDISFALAAARHRNEYEMCVHCTLFNAHIAHPSSHFSALGSFA